MLQGKTRTSLHKEILEIDPRLPIPFHRQINSFNFDRTWIQNKFLCWTDRPKKFVEWCRSIHRLLGEVPKNKLISITLSIIFLIDGILHAADILRFSTWLLQCVYNAVGPCLWFEFGPRPFHRTLSLHRHIIAPYILWHRFCDSSRYSGWHLQLVHR